MLEKEKNDMGFTKSLDPP